MRYAIALVLGCTPFLTLWKNGVSSLLSDVCRIRPSDSADGGAQSSPQSSPALIHKLYTEVNPGQGVKVIYIMRHSESAANAATKHLSCFWKSKPAKTLSSLVTAMSPGPGLSEHGEDLCKDLCSYLLQYPPTPRIDRVLVSPLRRCMLTYQQTFTSTVLYQRAIVLPSLCELLKSPADALVPPSTLFEHDTRIDEDLNSFDYRVWQQSSHSGESEVLRNKVEKAMAHDESYGSDSLPQIRASPRFISRFKGAENDATTTKFLCELDGTTFLIIGHSLFFRRWVGRRLENAEIERVFLTCHDGKGHITLEHPNAGGIVPDSSTKLGTNM